MNKKVETWRERDVSWSQLNAWRYSKKQWAEKYLFGIEFDPTPSMLFGNKVGDTLGLGKKKSMVPKLEPYLVGDKEHEIRVKLNDRYLLGYCDHYCPDKKILNENKTSQNPNRWNQVEVDRHGQLTMYALMLFLRDGTVPDELEIWLNFIPVENREFGGLHIPDRDLFYRIPTKRTVKQCLDFGANIQRTLKEMEEYACTIA